MKKNHDKKVTALSEEIVRLADEKLVLSKQVTTQEKELETFKASKADQKIEHQRDENEVSKEVVRLTAEVSNLKEQLALKEKELTARPRQTSQPKVEATPEPTVSTKDLEALATLEEENKQLKADNNQLTTSLSQAEVTIAEVQSELVEAAPALTPAEEANLSKLALIEKMEGQGFEYKKITTNNFEEKVALGVKQRGDHLVVQLFYLNDEAEQYKNPQVSIRLQSSLLYDYKVLHYDTEKAEDIIYDVEVKTPLGNKKLTKYVAGYLEDIQTYREKGSGNGRLMLEHVFHELALRSVPTLTGSLSVAQRTEFEWLKPYLINLGFEVPPTDDVGKISREI